MPPKKKKSGKKKKGKKSGNKSAQPMGNTEQLSELSKEFFLIQIRDLENRLVRYQQKCDELVVANGQFQKKYDQMSTEKKDIVSFLKKSLAQRGEELEDLNDRLVGLQQAKDTEKESYESQLQQIRTEFQETKDQLTSENMILGGKLASLEEFRVQKEDLMNKFALMEENLQDQESLHQDAIYKLEKKQVVDKDRLKKEMVMRVNQVAAEFRKVSNKQMAETTKRTIRENVSINAQLGKMSDKTLELIQENDDMKDKEKKQRQQIDLLEANEKELAKKNHSNQRVIRMLTEKCKNQEMLIQELEQREEEYQDLESESDLLRQQVESSREELDRLAREHELVDEDLQRSKGELTKLNQEKHKVETVLAQAAEAIKHALSTRTSEDVEESPYEQIEKRDSMLEHLLVLLNSAAAIGIGPTPAEFGMEESPRAKSASKIPGSGQGIRRGDIPMSPIAKTGGTLPHYQLGDLGLVPRPKQHILTNFEKMQELSVTTRLGGLKKVLTKSVAVQTVSAPKAMFFADQLLSKMPQNQELLHDLRGSNDRPMLPSIPSARKIPTKVF